MSARFLEIHHQLCDPYNNSEHLIMPLIHLQSTPQMRFSTCKQFSSILANLKKNYFPTKEIISTEDLRMDINQGSAGDLEQRNKQTIRIISSRPNRWIFLTLSFLHLLCCSLQMLVSDIKFKFGKFWVKQKFFFLYETS